MSTRSLQRAGAISVGHTFVEGGGVSDVFAVEQDASGKCFDLALAYARGIGGTRASVIERLSGRNRNRPLW